MFYSSNLTDVQICCNCNAQEAVLPNNKTGQTQPGQAGRFPRPFYGYFSKGFHAPSDFTEKCVGGGSRPIRTSAKHNESDTVFVKVNRKLKASKASHMAARGYVIYLHTAIWLEEDIPDPGSSVLDPGCWILGPGSCSQNSDS